MTMSKRNKETSTKLLPAGAVCERYSIDRRTLSRWMASAKLAMPAPVKINDRPYFNEAELEAWERSRVATSAGKAA